MVTFFKTPENKVIAVQTAADIAAADIEKLNWLFGRSECLGQNAPAGSFVGPRKEMITPWSTNAVEITQNMGISGIVRIEEFEAQDADKKQFDPMLKSFYNKLDQSIFTVDIKPQPIVHITDIRAYNKKEGLALKEEEINYLEGLAKKLGRPLTDSEVFGFSQVNSEHCRHKIFGGQFIIDGEEKKETLFGLIKRLQKPTRTTWFRPTKTTARLCRDTLWSSLHRPRRRNRISLK